MRREPFYVLAIVLALLALMDLSGAVDLGHGAALLAVAVIVLVASHLIA